MFYEVTTVHPVHFLPPYQSNSIILKIFGKGIQSHIESPSGTQYFPESWLNHALHLNPALNIAQNQEENPKIAVSSTQIELQQWVANTHQSIEFLVNLI